VGDDFARNDERREENERSQANRSSSRPMTSGVSYRRGASDEKDGDHENRHDSTHGVPSTREPGGYRVSRSLPSAESERKQL
jgi:hypothetical protein